MKDIEKTKAQLIEELTAIRLKVRALEDVEKKYHALKAKIQRLEGMVGSTQGEGDRSAKPQGKPFKATLLVVDDNDVFRSFILNTLDFHGYRVLGAESSAEALQLLENSGESVDLILVDVVMPDVGGSELVQRVKAIYPKVKVLFMSGYTDEILVHSDVQEVIESDVAFLQKPFLTEELLKIVRKELEQVDI